MGLCNSPDIFQEKMGGLMAHVEYVNAYIDTSVFQQFSSRSSPKIGAGLNLVEICWIESQSQKILL